MLLKGPSNDELAGFDRLFVELAWISLFRGELTVADLRLEKLWATIRVAIGFCRFPSLVS